ncbi:helix-turn-helix transcriptional regulator [Microbacterium sp. NPDC057407]|uniref:helix-turn-helix transcriptional regulator n=1 Tax=Microbacterium sp. NPDC057407 TaxID=3346120 RepID=UPI0036733771
MQAFIQRSLASRLTVQDVAAAGDCSRATAERLFKRHTGHSIQTYVRNQKMERAAHLLRFTGHRVNEVARMVGFSDPLYFSRIFKQTFHASPRTFASERVRP